MCGIVGFIDPRGVDDKGAVELVRAMGKRIEQRGPDASGEWCDSEAGIVLGHRRLSINDLSPAGAQPMTSACGRYVIVLNGEIYNFHELRETLEQRGHRFRGHSDTEIALGAITEYGVVGALKRFVGMYAFGLWDAEEKALWLARDRVGEKPLYYGQFGAIFGFASDINALRAHPQWEAEIDSDAIGLMMQHLYIPAPRSIYKNIHKLPAAHVLRIDLDAGLQIGTPESYWSIFDLALSPGSRTIPTDPLAATDALDKILRETIRNKMISDVPLGAFLSGGIDSSTVVALMQSQSSTPVQTFSIGFSEKEFDEAQEAKKVASHLRTDHTELYVTPDEARSVIPGLPALYSEPFADSSQIPTYLVSKLARSQVTVALSGDGGDELFGGYNRYRYAESAWKSQQRWPLTMRRALGTLAGFLSPAMIDSGARAIRPLLPPQLRYKQFGNRINKLATVVGVDDPIALYRLLISMWQRPSQVVLKATDVMMLQRYSDVLSKMPEFAEQMMLADFLTYLPDDILTKVDRASMGVSLEVRVPFLDHRVIDFAWRTPLSLKVTGGETKWLLKQVLYRYVPAAMVDRPKMGFGVPIDEWLRGPLRTWGNDLLDEQRLQSDGYLDHTEVRRVWGEHVDGKADWGSLLWPVLMFQSWREHYH